MSSSNSSTGTSTIQILPESSSAQQSIAQSLMSQSINQNQNPQTDPNSYWEKYGKYTIGFLAGSIPAAIVTFFITLMSVKSDIALNSVGIAEVKKDIETLKESDKKIESVEKSINEIHTDLAIIKDRNPKK